MIKFRLLLFFLAASTLLFNSCEKIPGHATGVISTGGTTTGGGSTGGGGTTSSGSMTFKVDGSSKTAALTIATYFISSGNSIQISGQIGQIGSQEGLSIMIQNPAVGTFDVATNSTIFTYSVTATNYYMATTTGTVTITAFTSSTVTGTFSFTGDSFSGAGTKLITNGNFNMPYTKM